MSERLEMAKEELKRADHLIYVSLKYTRTVDVIKNVILRLISTVEYGIDALFEELKSRKKIQAPTTPIEKCDLLKQIYSDDKELKNYLDFYLLLRKINQAEVKREREYRRHVTMVANLGTDMMNVDIDLIYKYFEKTKSFIDYVTEKAD